jgi:hypothetical protein
MKNTNKYTFEDWYHGNVILKDATIVTAKGEKIQLIDYADFSDEDAFKIKKIQKQIFDEKVKSLLEQHTEQFEKRHSASEMKDELLENEIKQCDEILFKAVPNTDPVFLSFWGNGLDYDYLVDVQLYVSRTIVKGIDDGVGFIHSPNSKHEDKRRPDSRVYSMAIWMYLNWLKSNVIYQESNKTHNGKLTLKEENEDKIWFKIGLHFANGDLDRLLHEYKKGTASNYTAIAKELGNKNYRPYISESVHGIKRGNKNIFSIPEKVNYVEEYCEKHGITIVESFYVRKACKNLK